MIIHGKDICVTNCISQIKIDSLWIENLVIIPLGDNICEEGNTGISPNLMTRSCPMIIFVVYFSIKIFNILHNNILVLLFSVICTDSQTS